MHMILPGSWLEGVGKIHIILVLSHTTVSISVNIHMEVIFYNKKSRWRISPSCKFVVYTGEPLGKLSFLFISDGAWCGSRFIWTKFWESSKCLMAEHCFHDSVRETKEAIMDGLPRNTIFLIELFVIGSIDILMILFSDDVCLSTVTNPTKIKYRRCWSLCFYQI